MTEVSETLMNVEQAIRRTQRAQAEVARIGYVGGAREALEAVLQELVSARDRLFQASYLVPAPDEAELPVPEPTTLFPELEPAEQQPRLV